MKMWKIRNVFTFHNLQHFSNIKVVQRDLNTTKENKAYKEHKRIYFLKSLTPVEPYL
jgi:hypothetical protein